MMSMVKQSICDVITLGQPPETRSPAGVVVADTRAGMKITRWLNELSRGQRAFVMETRRCNRRRRDPSAVLCEHRWEVLFPKHTYCFTHKQFSRHIIPVHGIKTFFELNSVIYYCLNFGVSYWTGASAVSAHSEASICVYASCLRSNCAKQAPSATRRNTSMTVPPRLYRVQIDRANRKPVFLRIIPNRLSGSTRQFFRAFSLQVIPCQY
ncbi:uncharacterized protein LOC110974312 isoform X3 [Acanthaster planci]|uniref:Uncharacterized protein LOC110974312 isoform X3 n=1 Tax=Acanthaster planci TaxID=133434 RepID=A0A8B7XND1_ACAPL|nr:uncharacterized protein LOC110974312 isoform X3 [Acanthaster planci]